MEAFADGRRRVGATGVLIQPVGTGAGVTRQMLPERRSRLCRIFLVSFLFASTSIYKFDTHTFSRKGIDWHNFGQEERGWNYDEEGVRVFSPSNSTSNVAICLIVKNETRYLDEWVEFHVALGFSPIYIYDNSDEFELMDSGFPSWFDRRMDIRQHIQLAHFPTRPWYGKDPQRFAYRRCFFEDAVNSTYVAIFDVDEFLVLKTHDNVVDFMDHHCTEEAKCGQLLVNWRIMGVSGRRRYSPEPITKRNVHWSDEHSRSNFVKGINRRVFVADDNDNWVHGVRLKSGYRHLDTTGQPRKAKYKYTNTRNPTDVAVFFHYALKSEEELYYKTCFKSRPDGASRCNDPNYYKLYNGTVFDDAAWRQLLRMVPRYRRFGEAANGTF
ncbi:hypothetical protein THAOC_05561 [Thalassiosira oceanica]|uniref:Glycosyltransferase family 92 protein n=1 Tax=Thalassiosira oceanica TaxID=159749 RepID=K0T5C9_THAOC|nr:hypothetical protein THAOC_05561 [Thalassiosira oceanica]|eukprot:EJK72860.1 hypothetical protein THAOC_05561 [Thalassiosira oceanica]